LIRSRLEARPEEIQGYLAANRKLPSETKILLALALNTPQSTELLVEQLAQLERAPNEEELLRLMENLNNAVARRTLITLLARDQARAPTLEAMLKVRNRIGNYSLGSVLADPLRDAWNAGQKELAARVAGSFKVAGLAATLEQSLAKESTAVQIAALRALREMEVGKFELFLPLASSGERALRDEALNSISASASDGRALEFWNQFNPVQRRTALRRLSGTTQGAKHLATALRDRKLDERDLDAETVDRLRQSIPGDSNIQEMAERLNAQFKPVLRLDGRNESFVDGNIELRGPFTVETWVRLDPGINNNDGILGVPGGPDFNFHDGRFRVYCGPEFGDRAIASKPMVPNSWTHLAVTRDAAGVIRVFINGELDCTDPRAVTNTFSGLDIGRTGPSGGTAGMLVEFRVWDRARSAAEIRGEFDRTYAGEALPPGLVHFAFAGEMRGGARVEKELDAPMLLTGAEAREQQAAFEKFRQLAEAPGDLEKGRALFASSCQICHTVGGQGTQIGPVLNGAAASGVEAMLRAILTPNAAMEAGYRTFRVELNDGDIVDGFLVSRTDDALLIRQPNAEDQRIPAEKIRRAEFTRNSLMPEGLLQALSDDDVRHLFAFLKTLK
jgi:putative heme-binding domain-containing protein